MLRADHLSFAYGRTEVLHGVSFRVPTGGLTGILGPNGSGKTTLLKLLAGLLSPSKGSVWIGEDEANVAQRSRRSLALQMALVPQETQLAFDYSVLEITLMGRYPHLGPLELESPGDLHVARAALAATGTAGLEQRPFSTLSGGEKQRVIIASALAQLAPSRDAKNVVASVPSVLLLDEPTASLDLSYQLEVAAILRTLNIDRATAMVVSTHDLNFAASVCRDLVILRGGRVLEAGPTEEVLTAKNIRAAYDVEVDVKPHAVARHLTVVPIARVPPSIA